ncbi:hypothetical protein GCM10011386_35490 [Parapedobacter defluvii]|uniref:Error-prone repair protein ImuA n=1 Tax=Parapedobacter defluvii TaxID=2045106 RepID=A0ABQ1MGS4_9SPHI|nr:Error-prone repair protein ImuA [Parapedobacter defluvii]GGC40315.1 hypothetical protein GCM10011386_35490 [Parapedobacter defluvii]
MAVLTEDKRKLIGQLQKHLLRWQGFKSPENSSESIGLGSVERAFPNAVFPIGSIHEFIGTTPEQAAATSGFIGGILAALMRKGGVCLWISTSNRLFPPAIKHFGVEPDRIIFIEARREKDILWALEEALKCDRLIAAVAELHEIDFNQSLRLQLAVEKSRVTGFVFRSNPLRVGNTACAARWQITPLPSESDAGMPGVGLPKWGVELLKVRNGNPGYWELKWSAGQFIPVSKPAKLLELPMRNRKIG